MYMYIVWLSWLAIKRPFNQSYLSINYLCLIIGVCTGRAGRPFALPIISSYNCSVNYYCKNNGCD